MEIQLHTTQITVTRSESNFDRACDAAYERTLMKFGINEDGHSDTIKDFCRSTDSIHVAFKGYERIGGMGGQEHIYNFTASVNRNVDEDEEE